MHKVKEINGMYYVKVDLEFDEDQYKKLEKKLKEKGSNFTEGLEQMIKFILEEYDDYWEL